MFKQLRRRVMGIAPEETTVARRGFTVRDDGVRDYLEEIGRVFTQGYHTALLNDDPNSLAAQLNAEIDNEYRGFAFEGAAMGLAMLDMLIPFSDDRIRRFVDGPGNDHYYMSHVGVGWAWAHMKRRVSGPLKRLDPIVGWLAVEGYGFHETYFNWPSTLDRQERPKHMTGYTARVFDQGVGRCLWFARGADPELIDATIAAFPAERRADLWSGVGLSGGYAGGVDASVLRDLTTAAGAYRPQLAQGTVFAAATRQRAKNEGAHTELACQIICNMSLTEAADLANRLKPEESGSGTGNGSEPAWEVWRQRVQEQFITEEVFA